MPAQMLGRPGNHCLYTRGSCDLPLRGTVLYKQTNYGFYRPGAISISNLLADLPFAAVRVLIFDIIVYFMTHLARSAGGFFTFHLFQFMAFLCMQVRGLQRQLETGTLTCVFQSFFRLFGILCSNFDTAFRFVRHKIITAWRSNLMTGWPHSSSPILSVMPVSFRDSFRSVLFAEQLD